MNGIDSTTIMGGDLNLVKKRHYANFSSVVERLIEKKLGRKIGFLAAEK